MNQDIIQEILQNLYYVDIYCTKDGKIKDNQVKTAKKVLVSAKKWKALELVKFDKPIVYSILTSDLKPGENIDLESEHIAYHSITLDGKRRISRAFYRGTRIYLPRIVEDIYSIGELTDLSEMFVDCNNFNKNIGKNLDTSRVTNMSYMFYNCENLNKNIGKNWDTSNVTNMNAMFWFCKNLNKNIGKKWNTSKVEYMSKMFYGCQNLSRNIGENWDTSNVVEVTSMFTNCTNIDKNIGKNWDKTKIFNKLIFDFRY